MSRLKKDSLRLANGGGLFAECQVSQKWQSYGRHDIIKRTNTDKRTLLTENLEVFV